VADIKSESPAGFRRNLHFQDKEGLTSLWDTTLTRVDAHNAILVVARDITAQKNREEQLRQVAYHDGLTGLLNRAALKEKLNRYIVDATESGAPFAFIMIDLDNFKQINDMLGHDAGDVVLIEAAKRLSKAVTENSIVARLGGDEFAAIVQMPRGRLGLMPVLEQVLKVLREPLPYRGRLLDARASIGISVYPEHGRTATELLKNADIALYASKAFGRGGLTYYASAMGNALRKRASSIDAVREAISQQRVEAFYQPKIELISKAIVGFEAILRLRDSGGQLLSAQSIMQASENVDVAQLIGDCVFDQVAADVRTWREAGIEVRRVALNASPAEFRSGDFAPRLLEKLRRADLPPDIFEVEVTETVLTGRGTDYVATALKDLADAGLQVTLDNFGTGASSLAQLRRLPFSAIKIDDTFIGAVDDQAEDYTIVRAIIGLAEGLGLGITAVGIQTATQSTALQKLGCKVGQEDFVGPCLSSKDIAISDWNRVDLNKN
jgi:diguanylate cyclase (GGDEF)-like protein